MQNSMGDPSQNNQNSKKDGGRGKYTSNTVRNASPARGVSQSASTGFFLPGMGNNQKAEQRRADRQLKLGMVSQSVGGAKQDGIGFPNRRNKNYESQASSN